MRDTNCRKKPPSNHSCQCPHGISHLDGRARPASSAREAFGWGQLCRCRFDDCGTAWKNAFDRGGYSVRWLILLIGIHLNWGPVRHSVEHPEIVKRTGAPPQNKSSWRQVWFEDKTVLPFFVRKVKWKERDHQAKCLQTYYRTYSQHGDSSTWKIMCDLKELASL